MKFELLVRDGQDKKRLANFGLPAGVKRRTYKYESDGSLFSIVFEKDGTSLALAIELAELRDSIYKLEYRLLDDEPSLRFGQDLYRKTCVFERLLRKLIMLCVYGESGSFEDEQVATLEGLDFGKLFNYLFIDRDFNSNAKDVIRRADAPFEKSGLLSEISDIEEHNIWRENFSEDDMPTVAQRHREIQSLRNDVMHSQRISVTQYKEGMKLLKKANSEIESYLEERKGHNAPQDPLGKTSFYDSIKNAMKASEQLAAVQSALLTPEVIDCAKKYQSLAQETEGMRKMLETCAGSIASNLEYRDLQSQIAFAAMAAALNIPKIEKLDLASSLSSGHRSSMSEEGDTKEMSSNPSSKGGE